MAASPANLEEASVGWMSEIFENFVRDCVVGTGRCSIMLDRTYTDALWVRHQKEDIACALHETKYRVSFQSTSTTPKMMLRSYETLGAIRDPLLSYLSITQSLVNLLTGAIGFWSAEEDCETEQEIHEGKPNHAKNYTCEVTTSFTSVRTKIWSTLLVGALNLSNTTDLPGTYRDDLTPSISSEDKALARNLTLGPLIEELSRNLTLNLFSNPHFL